MKSSTAHSATDAPSKERSASTQAIEKLSDCAMGFKDFAEEALDLLADLAGKAASTASCPSTRMAVSLLKSDPTLPVEQRVNRAFGAAWAGPVGERLFDRK